MSIEGGVGFVFRYGYDLQPVDLDGERLEGVGDRFHRLAHGSRDALCIFSGASFSACRYQGCGR